MKKSILWFLLGAGVGFATKMLADYIEEKKFLDSIENEDFDDEDFDDEWDDACDDCESFNCRSNPKYGMYNNQDLSDYAFEEYVKNQEKINIITKNVIVVREIATPEDNVNLMDEIHRCTVTENGDVIVPEGCQYIMKKADASHPTPDDNEASDSTSLHVPVASDEDTSETEESDDSLLKDSNTSNEDTSESKSEDDTNMEELTEKADTTKEEAPAEEAPKKKRSRLFKSTEKVTEDEWTD